MIFKYFFILWFTLFFGGIAFTIWIIYYMIKKRKSQKPADIEKKLLKDIRKKAPKLSIHQDHDIFHLHSRESQYFTMDGISANRGKGILSDENHDKFLYYTWIDTVIIESKLQLMAKTTSKLYYIQFKNGVIIFRINNQILGYHYLRKGLFYDRNKQIIGQINQNVGNPPKTKQRFDVFREEELSDYPIEFKSGTRAYITNKSRTPSSIAVSKISETASEVEKDIVMAFAIQYILFTRDRVILENNDSSDWLDIDLDVF